MSFIDNLKTADNSQLSGTNKKFIDADTLVDTGGNRYRLAGINAPEVEKVIDGEYKMGTAGGQASTEAIQRLANSQGFTNVTPALGDDGEPLVDSYGRQVVHLKDSTGKTFEHALLESGVLQPTTFETTSDTDRLTYNIGQLRREQAALRGTQSDYTDWDAARDQITQAMEAEGHKQQGFRRAALDEKQLAQAKAAGLGHYYQTDNVQFRDYGRSLDNKSLNPLSDSWEQGWLGVAEGAYGALNMLGEVTGSEYLTDVGEAGTERIRSQLADDYGTTITDWKEVDDISSGLQFLGNNAAMSLPYMALAVGSATLAAPVGAAAAGATGVAAVGTAVGATASVLAPATVYTGQVWNEMEGEKNAGVAVASGVAQATLDRLGLSLIGSQLKGKGSKAMLTAAVKELQKKGMTKAQAEKTVADASRKELAGYLGDTAKVAREQIEAKKIASNLFGKYGVGAAGEGLTEVGQETIAYTGATLGSDKVFDWEELKERQIAAAIAGGALGGAFSVPGAAFEAGAWADVAVRQAPADAKRQARAAQWAEAEVKEHGRVKSIKELNEETTDFINKQGPNVIPSLEERIALDKQRRTSRTFGESFAETVTAIPGAAWKGSIRHIIPDQYMEQSRALRKLGHIFGGQLQKTYSGAAFENEKHHRVAQYKNMVPIPDKYYAQFNNGNIVTSRKRKGEISNKIYEGLRNGDPAFAELKADLDRLGEKMWQDQKKHNPDLGKIDNYLTRYKSFNKAAVKADQEGFVSKLVNKGVDLAEAKQIAEAISEDPNVNDLGEAFSTIKGEYKPAAHQKRSLDLSEDPEFNDYMEQDLFANISNAARSAARYTTQQDYVGPGGSKVAALLQEAEQEGVSPAIVNKIAAGMQNYLDAESGNYKRATSEAGKKAEKIQRNFLTWSTIAGLPLAAISSFVELALTQKGLTLEQIQGKDGKGGLKKMGQEFGALMDSYFGQVAEYSVGKRPSKDTEGQQVLRNLGFYEWDVGASTVVGATEVSATQRKTMDAYFKAIGLTQWTDYTRAIRGSIAADYLEDKFKILEATDPEFPTNESQEAKEALRNLGVNVEDGLNYRKALLTGTNSPSMDEAWADGVREATFNFINDAVALPQAANRPLIYQDPRFALFTQFQGFIATFTANHIPKLWDEYVRRGTPAMKYNAFAVMSMMIVLGFASQYLKDLIKYGDGKNPYLENPEYVQRGIRASGLLGSAERILDQFAPIYEDRSDGILDWAYNTTTGESPAISNVQRAGKAGKRFLEGDFSEGARNLSKVTPLSPLTGHLWEPGTQEWKFK